MLHNIPDEMKSFDQWVVWKEGKVPYSPQWGGKASVNDPSTWSDFPTACQALRNEGVLGLGFVLTEADPYGFIDLDNAWKKNEAGLVIHPDPQAVHDRQVKIFNMFESYTERSPSGEGLHIIVKAPNMPNGRKRSSIELYTSGRFMTMTGDRFNEAPINDRGELFEVLWKELGGKAQVYNVVGDIEQRNTDEEVFNMASTAANGPKFVDLWNGDWEKYYNTASQSEADFALVDIIAFYTQNREQIVRLFHMSKLGERDKAQRTDYMNYMVNKSFDRQLPLVDMDGINSLMNEARQKALAGNNGAVEGPTAPASHEPPITTPGSVSGSTAGSSLPAINQPVKAQIDLPPGLVGDIARFIYEASPRPVMPIALTGALGLVAGIVGRAYNVSNTGLNQYVMLIAPTGSGKEAINMGISRLVEAVASGSDGVPAIRDFIGPGDMASGVGLLKWFAKSKAFVAVLGEIGLTLSRVSQFNANPHDKAILKVWLDLYGKSGHGNVLNPAGYSDSSKNMDPVQSPAFSMVGESTPEKFFEALDETMVSSGLLPRFTIIEYNGFRPPFNEAAGLVTPPADLVKALGALVSHVNHINRANGNVVNVPFSGEARTLLNQFNEYADGQINSNGAEVTKQLWNRAHLNAMKLAAVVAVGIAPNSPVIDYSCAKWATDLVSSNIAMLLGRFERGEVGVNPASFTGDEPKQHKETVKWLKKVFSGSAADAEAKYKIPSVMFNSFCVPKHVITSAMQHYACFRNTKGSARGAVKATLDFMKESGELVELPKQQAKDAFDTGQTVLQLSDPNTFFK